jgi:hypothetical protein
MSDNNSRDFEIIMAESLSLAALNAVMQQQLDGIVAQAVSTMAATQILGSIASAPGATGIEEAKSNLSPASALPETSEIYPIHEVSEEQTATARARHAGVAQGNAADMALQLVAQLVALSVQNAASHLGSLRVLCTAAIGRSLGQLESTGDVKSDSQWIRVAQDIVAKGSSEFHYICREATTLLEQISDGRSLESAQAADRLESPSEALSVALDNAIQAQQQANVRAQASTTMGIATLYSLVTAATGLAEKKELGGDPPPPGALTPTTS